MEKLGPEHFLFVHVPKTAGTSFRLALEHSLGSRHVAYDYSRDSPETHDLVKNHYYEKRNFRVLADAFRVADIRILGGHFAYRKFERLFEPEQVIAFVRDPVARVVSEFCHAARHNGFRGSLREFVERPRNTNLQSTMLEGLPLERVGFIGVAEQYEKSLAVLRAVTGWSLPNLVKNVNPMRRAQLSKSYELDVDLEKDLRHANRRDIALYDRCVRLLDERRPTE